MQIHVQLAVAVRSSLTGEILSDSGLLADVEGDHVRMIRKSDGFVLFTGLRTGEQSIRFSHAGYRDARLKVCIEPGKTKMEVLTLRPLYLNPAGALRLTVKGLTPGTECAVAVQQLPFSLQAETVSGSACAKLYRRSSAMLLMPNKLLCADPEGAEICILKDRTGEDTWEFSGNLKFPHKRGVKFYPVQLYEADAEGKIQALIFAEGKVSVFYDGKLYEMELKEDKEWQIP